MAVKPRLEAILHADDCGLSVGITDGILGCYDRGALQRTSVVTNGVAWDYAVAALGRRQGLAVALHLNLFEGSPLTDPDQLDLLVDRRGRFNKGFAALSAMSLAGRFTARLRAQVRLELRHQIERFLAAFADRGPLTVDGHVHYHVVPVVFAELLTLSAEYPIGAIRLPREMHYWPFITSVPRPPLINIAKNVVLRTLCRRVAPALRSRSVRTTDAFIGVLGTGSMTLAHVRAGLECLRRRGTSGCVEVLFHPGRAKADEASIWHHRPALLDFYRSANRDYEAELLKTGVLRQLLHAYDIVDPEATPSRPSGITL